MWGRHDGEWRVFCFCMWFVHVCTCSLQSWLLRHEIAFRKSNCSFYDWLNHPNYILRARVWVTLWGDVLSEMLMPARYHAHYLSAYMPMLAGTILCNVSCSKSYLSKRACKHLLNWDSTPSLILIIYLNCCITFSVSFFWWLLFRWLVTTHWCCVLCSVFLF